MRILWATDGSAAAEAATAYLRGPFNRREHRITVAAVAPSPLLSDARTDPSMLLWHFIPDYRERVSEAVTELVVRQTALLDGVRAEVTSAIRLGPAPVGILSLATEEQSDLVIMGAHGHGAARELLLGSVSRQVAVNAPCAVLVVRARRAPRRLLVAYDGSPDADAALDLLTALKSDRAEVTLAHVMEPAPVNAAEARRLGVSVEDMSRQHRTQARAMLNAPTRRLRAAGWAVETVTREGRTAQSLLALAHERNPDLLLLGARGTHSLDSSDHRASGLAQRVLADARCSVLVARARAS